MIDLLIIVMFNTVIDRYSKSRTSSQHAITIYMLEIVIKIMSACASLEQERTPRGWEELARSPASTSY